MRNILFLPLLLTAACHGPVGGDPLDTVAPTGVIVGPPGGSSDPDRDRLRHADRADRGESGLRGFVGANVHSDL